jgi:hypothetical protein
MSLVQSLPRLSKTSLKVSYIQTMRLLNLIKRFLFVVLHVSVDIYHHQVLKVLMETAGLLFCGSNIRSVVPSMLWCISWCRVPLSAVLSEFTCEESNICSEL